MRLPKHAKSAAKPKKQSPSMSIEDPSGVDNPTD
jgi:hypothetical protein